MERGAIDQPRYTGTLEAFLDDDLPSPSRRGRVRPAELDEQDLADAAAFVETVDERRATRAGVGTLNP